jgi:hypothetical protein
MYGPSHLSNQLHQAFSALISSVCSDARQASSAHDQDDRTEVMIKIPGLNIT